MAEESSNSADSGVIVRIEFVRHRNAMLVRGSFQELFVDYYLHLADHGVRLEPWQDARLKNGLIAIALHASVRPHQEIIAWTVNFQEPPLNLFLGADNEDFTLVVRAFSENVRIADHQILHAEQVRNRRETRRSSVNFTGDTVFAAAAELYARSEQRPARFFHLEGDDYALLLQQPDCDVAWFDAVDMESLLKIDERETVVPIERRRYTWSCGCSDARLMRVLAPQMKADPDELFAGDEILHVQCPRCAARYTLTREAMEAWMAANP